MTKKPAKRPATGRPSLYTPKIGGRIIDLILTGVSFEAAAASCGVSKSVLWNWIRDGARAFRKAGPDALGFPLPADLEALQKYRPPDLSTFSEAIHMARGVARSLHEANFARHAREDWRASYAWLRHRANHAWGDSPERDDVAPRKARKPAPQGDLITDLGAELTAARARLHALREIIAGGGTSALPLDRAIALEAGTMASIGRLAKAQHEINPAAGKGGDFKVLIELTEGAAAVDPGPRVPDLEARGKKTDRKPLEPEASKSPVVGGDGWDDP